MSKQFLLRRCTQLILGGFFLIGMAFLGIYWHERSDGFSLSCVSSDLPYNRQWEIAIQPKDRDFALKILDQPYTYLGKGRQCYVFLSRDGLYVLKLFKYQRMRYPKWVKQIWLPSGLDEWRRAKVLFRENKLKNLFNSLSIAYSQLRDATGLLFVHLNKTTDLHKCVYITDKAGKAFCLDLDEMEFVLQKRAKLIFNTFEKLLQQQRIDEVKARIDQLIELFQRRAQKGIVDLDSYVIARDNLGFLEDRAVYIDTGSFIEDTHINSHSGFSQDLERLEPVHKWLKEQSPDLAHYFEIKRNQALQRFKNSP